MRTLDDAATFLSGGTPKKSDPRFWGGDIPWYSASNMDARYLGDTEITITDAGLDAGSRIAPAGSTLLLVRGSGLFNYIPICFAEKDVAFNQDVKALVPKSGVDPSFLHFWIESLRADLNENIGTTGIGAGKFDTDYLKALPFPVLDFDEQTRRGAWASVFDRKIVILREINRSLVDIARTLFRGWFINFEPVRAKMAGATSFRGMPQDLFDILPNDFQSSEIGEIPTGWTLEPLIEQASWINGAAYKNMHFSNEPDALPVVKIAELKSGIGKGTQFTNTDLGAKYRITTGELMFSWSGSPETSIDAFIWPLGDAWLNQHIFAVRSNGKKRLGYLFALLKHLKPELIRIAKNKQTTGLGHITRDDMARLLICEPSPPMLSWFSDFAQDAYDRILSNLIEIQTLSSLRDALLPKLLAGELDIPTLEAVGLKAVGDGG